MIKSVSDRALKIWNAMYSEQLDIRKRRPGITGRFYFSAQKLKTFIWEFERKEELKDLSIKVHEKLHIDNMPTDAEVKQIIQELVNVGMLIQDIDGRIFISDPVEIVRQKQNDARRNEESHS